MNKNLKRLSAAMLCAGAFSAHAAAPADLNYLASCAISDSLGSRVFIGLCVSGSSAYSKRRVAAFLPPFSPT